MMRGRFITFEGGEGCGKSTQVRRLAGALEARGLQVVLTREPGGTRLAEQIRALLREELEDPPCDKAELLLFLAARAQLVQNVIRPALQAGSWVISDRFSDSTFAYQGYGRGLDLSLLKTMNAFATDELVPDRTFFLDVTCEESARRMRLREQATATQADRIECAGAAFHARLREGFLALAAADRGRIVQIDAHGSVDEVWERIWKSLQPLI